MTDHSLVIIGEEQLATGLLLEQVEGGEHLLVTGVTGRRVHQFLTLESHLHHVLGLFFYQSLLLLFYAVFCILFLLFFVLLDVFYVLHCFFESFAHHCLFFG